MTDERDTTEEEMTLEAHFAAARQASAQPGDAMMARVMADALAAQEVIVAEASAQPKPPVGRFGFWTALGGWRGMAGLSCAMLTGVWIGIAPPDALAVTAQTVLRGEALLAWETADGLFFGEEAL